MADKLIAPSLLAADYAKLGDEAKRVLAAGADWIHLDIMDNHFVPNLSFGPEIVKSLRNAGIDAPMDVHLMTKPVENLIHAFADCGADMITIHAEADDHIDRHLSLIRDLGCLAGLAFNPATPLSTLEYLLVNVDLILIMSVNPGWGGQTFIQAMLKKIKHAKQIISKAPQEVRLSVDGGVTAENIGAISRAGADTFVVGSAIFKTSDYNTTIENLRTEASRL